MPNFKQHFIAGLAVGATINLVSQLNRRGEDTTFDFGELCVCSLLAAGAASVPDMLEPATSPNHRGFFHSLVMAAFVAYSMSDDHTKRLSPAVRYLLLLLGPGYLSHLVLDARTPKCIPWV